MDGPKRARSGKPRTQPRADTCSRPSDLQNLRERIRQAASRAKGLRLTSLWHHVYAVESLREAYFGLRRAVAPGMDGETWQHYGENLEANLQDLSDRLARGAYRAKPVLRVHIPKGDGGQRPIGIPVLEDKIVQRAAVDVLNCIYETDFVGFSYGFRPGRGAHDALDALTVGIKTRKVSWVLDADIRGFFDAIDHECLIKFTEHRIADKRVVRHIKKWLNAGVLVDGERIRVEEGTPQGGSISPLLANVYLHYVFDLWADQWRHKQGRGDVIIVRYADDFVVGFQHRADAEDFLLELQERMRSFNLDLHPGKTRLLEFGRFAASNRKGRGDGKPETFDFLGFTHICGKTRNGRFTVRHQTMRKRMQRKLRELKSELRRRMHLPVREVGKWLQTVLLGYYRYYGVPYNRGSLNAFRWQVIRTWYHTLRRRSQRDRTTWARMYRLADHWLPLPRITHPFPEQRLRVTT